MKPLSLRELTPEGCKTISSLRWYVRTISTGLRERATISAFFWPIFRCSALDVTIQ
jgi:hypothetical protein